MPPKKPLASISLDLDNQWSYMKTHGDSGWKTFPTYLPVFIPKILHALDRLSLKITFFIVGQDAALEKNRPYLQWITESGHEVGNHSYHHEPWLQRYSKKRLRDEILRAEERIVVATGEKPIGFRGPGFSWSADLFHVLAEQGYLYDASTLPTFLGPLARAYYFRHANLKKPEIKDRAELFGSFGDGFKPIKPYLWQLSSNKNLLEIPVSTMPIFKLPFHLSYLLYISRISIHLMKSYLRTALRLCRLTNTEPSFLLHPLDLMGGDLTPELKFFPGMDLTTERKLELFFEVMEILSKHFTLTKMSAHAEAALRNQQTVKRSVPSSRGGSSLKNYGEHGILPSLESMVRQVSAVDAFF